MKTSLIYKKIYNFDFGEKLDVFDFAFNTDLLPLDSLIDLSKKIVQGCYEFLIYLCQTSVEHMDQNCCLNWKI